MAKQTSLYLTKGIKVAQVTITSTDTTTLKTLYTASADDAVVKSITCATDDTVVENLRIFLTVSGGSPIQIGTVNIPIGSGTTGSVSSVDILNSIYLPSLPIDRNGKRILPLSAGTVVSVACLATMTASKTTSVTLIAEEY